MKSVFDNMTSTLLAVDVSQNIEDIQQTEHNPHNLSESLFRFTCMEKSS